MRTAKVLDWFRRLRERKTDWPLAVTRVSVKGVPSRGEIEVPIFSPLTVLAGANGVGKSTLLRAIWAALDPALASTSVLENKKLVAGSITVEYRESETSAEATTIFGGGTLDSTVGPGISVVHIDSSVAASWDQSYFCNFDSTEDITNGSGALNLDAAALSEINYIVRREYRSVTVYEVESSEEAVLPFFEVSYGNDQYDSRTMGSGEVAALYIWWALNRAPNNSVLLCEEPEAFLSAASQKALTNHIVAITVQKKLCTIISSHSPHLISALPRESLQFLIRGQNGLQLVTDQAPPLLLENLGIEMVIRAILLVEDKMASHVVRAALEKFDAAMSRRVHIAIKNGEGEITNALKALGNLGGPLKFLGVYDGDQRGKTEAGIASRAAYLPGKVPMEEAFKAMVTENPTAASEAFGINDIRPLLAGLEGSNIHDWYEEIGKQFGMTKAQLFHPLYRMWIGTEGNSKEIADTYERILELIEF